MFRFLHSADLHLGKPFGGFAPELQAQLRRARLEVLPRLAQAARDRGADLVVLAGDIFDVAEPAPRLVAQTLDALAAERDITWLCLPGNHDPHRPGGVWERLAASAPANLHLLLEAAPVAVAPALTVLPAPCRARRSGFDPTAWMDGAPSAEGALRLGIAHGAVVDFAEDGQGDTIDIDRAARAGLDYLALGDWHGLKQVGERAWYSGTPEPDRFKDNDPGRALVVEIDGPGAVPKVEAVSVGHFEWLRWEATFHDLEDVQAFAKKVHALERADRTLVRLEYEGSVPLDVHAALEEALDDARARLMELRERGPGVLIMPSEAELENLRLQGFVKAAVDELRAASADENDTEAAKALELFYKLHTSITSQA